MMTIEEGKMAMKEIIELGKENQEFFEGLNKYISTPIPKTASVKQLEKTLEKIEELETKLNNNEIPQNTAKELMISFAFIIRELYKNQKKIETLRNIAKQKILLKKVQQDTDEIRHISSNFINDENKIEFSNPDINVKNIQEQFEKLQNEIIKTVGVTSEKLNSKSN